MKTIIKRVGIISLLAMLTFTGASCRRGGDIDAQRAYQPISLEYWTVFNSPDDFTQIIADYRALHPNISIEVKKFRFEEYEETLVNALAEDRGPDIFSVHNTWLPSYRSKLLPMPPQTTLAYQYTTGSVRKETVTEFRTSRSMNEAELRRDFLEQVYEDVYIPELVTNDDGEFVDSAPAIYGLPVAFDTMVMYFNRDLLDNAGVAQPAEFWHEFQEDVQQMARFDSFGNIIAAGSAMGTADNIPRSTDILSVLMMQNGAVMIDENGEVLFDEIPDALRGTRSTVPGEEALRFYTSYANENNRNYTWTPNEVNAFEAFLQGKVAYFFGYNYHREQIEGLAPRLNYGVSGLPQIQGNPEVYFANYWVEGVSKKTRNADAAWDFVQFMTSADEVSKLLDQTQRPTARRDLITAQETSPVLGVYASQLLQSKSWYNGQDPAAAESILKSLIRDTLAGAADISDLLNLAADRVQQTLR
jgi:ABC-type glycerol-3-phosphate transport system substrate-binding protein